MPYVYDQAVRVAIGVSVRVVDTEEDGVEGTVDVVGSGGSDMIVSVL